MPEARFPEGRRALQAGLPWFFKVKTGSMKPVIWPGATVEVHPCDPADARTGDILCLDSPSGLLVHRLVGRPSVDGGAGILTQGDRCDGPDNPTAAGDVFGRVVSVSIGRWTYRLDGPVRAAVSRLVGAMWPLTRPLLSWRRRLSPTRPPQGPA